ncbi:MAG: aminotransferase class V-fold PLP-dependent enzyme [Pseudomonadota bacterium]|nr:MAG: aminotransferase class V-fold PLP-dependent enzyme [Pseudomonadota bacterium]
MIPSQRHLFEIPEEVSYLNCAYMSPLLKTGIRAGEAGIRSKGQPWNISTTDFFARTERTRTLFAQLIGATADDIFIVPAVSYAMGVAARNLPLAKGQRILLLADQFPSNVYPWRELAREREAEVVTLARPQDNDWTRSILEHIDRSVAVVALPHCHWVDGALVDLIAVGARCREMGAALVLDLTQSAGALPIDVKAVQPDFAVAAAYKWLLGPYTLGFCYVAPRWQCGQPLEYNWITREGSEDFARLVDYRDSFQPGARRFDMGERSHFQLMPVAEAGLEQLHAWGVAAIAQTLAHKTAAIVARAQSHGFTALSDPLRAGHYLGLRYSGNLPGDLPQRLSAHQVYISQRGDALRVTPHLYNNEADVERLFVALAACGIRGA